MNWIERRIEAMNRQVESLWHARRNAVAKIEAEFKPKGDPAKDEAALKAETLPIDRQYSDKIGKVCRDAYALEKALGVLRAQDDVIRPIAAKINSPEDVRNWLQAENFVLDQMANDTDFR